MTEFKFTKEQIEKAAKDNGIEIEWNSSEPGAHVTNPNGDVTVYQMDEIFKISFPFLGESPIHENRLQEILDTMDIPEHRKKDYSWLWRNLGVGTNNSNRNHPEYWDAMQLIKEKIKAGGV